MTESAPGPKSRGAGVWWEASPPGAATPVALVRVELTEPALPAEALPDEPALRRRTRYVAGIEYLARALGAAQPLSWEGDAVTLVLGGRPAANLAGAAYVAAQEIWQRMRLDLELGARIAAHVAVVAWGPEGLAAQEVGLRALLDLARPGMIAVSEDVALGLPDEAQQDLAPLGMAAEAPAYGFPREEVPPEEKGKNPEDEALWGALRAYARSPEIRILRYPGLRLGQRPPRLDVREIFVAPTLELLPAGRSGQGGSSKPARGSRAHAGRAKRSHPQDLKEILAEHRRLILLGDPGSGKSTLLRWMAVVASGGRFACAAELGIPERLLPVLVSLGRLAEMRRDSAEQDPCALLARYLAERGLGDETSTAAALARVLQEGRCLLLLDGLDEAEAEDRSALRQWIEALADAYPQSRLLVTSRLIGYHGLMRADGTDAILQPFGEAEVERAARALIAAIARWETGSAADSTDIDADAGALLGATRPIPGLRHLAGNPLGLATLTLIHRVEGSLPRHRVQAYEVFARTLCETWAEARRVVASEEPAAKIAYQEEGVPIFGQLALAMHERYPNGLAPEAFIREAVARALAEHRGLATAETERAAEEFLKRAREDVQILAERGPGVWGFLHLTFQEYFAAVGLHAAERFEEVALGRLFDPRWREVVRLGIGYQALMQRRPMAVRRFVEQVLSRKEPPPDDWISSILQLQIPVVTLLAAEAGDALPAPLQERIAADFAEWAMDPPDDHAVGAYLEELGSTDLSRHVSRALSRCIGQDGLSHLRNAERWSLAYPILWHATLGDTQSMEGLLTSANTHVRAAAIYGLVCATGRPLSYLRWALDGQPEEVRYEAMLALCELHPFCLDVAEIQELILHASYDESARVRSIATGLSSGDMKSIQRLEELARHDENPDVRGEAAGALVYHRGLGDDMELALDLLVDEYISPTTYNGILFALMDAGPPTTDDRLIARRQLALLRSDDDRLRAIAIDLTRFTTDRHETIIISCIKNDPSPRVREMALMALPAKEHVRKGQRPSIEQIILTSLADPVPGIRRAALQASSGWLRYQELQRVLLSAMQDADAMVRSEAVRRLSQLRRTKRIDDALLHALDDTDDEVVSAAAWVLGERGVRDSIPRLVALAPRYASARQALWTLATT